MWIFSSRKRIWRLRNMEKLIKKVEQWSIERGLNTADPSKQRLKLWEEFGELNAAIARDNREGAIDAIGDMLVVMIIYCQQQGYHETKELFEIKVKFFKLLKLLNINDAENLYYIAKCILDTRITIECMQDVVTILACMAEHLDTTLKECLQSAYNEIKDRKGKMINGVFVKESDLKN